MNYRTKILIVEDDKNILRFMRTVLQSNDYDVLTTDNGKEALSIVSSHCPDLMILDLGLPDADGLQLIPAIRAWSQISILVVSARSEETDKVAALDLGADDYLTKPFGISELLARIRTAIRHARYRVTNDSILQHGAYRVGDLVIDYANTCVLVEGKRVHLTQNEYKIVCMLGKRAGQVISYDTIIKELWGPTEANNTHILRVNIANIRRKIEKNPADPKYILTESSFGYRMAGEGDI